MSMSAGQPPQQMASAKDAKEVSHADGANEPLNSSDNDTAPVDSPRSHSVMVLMSTRAMRPAPLCVTASLAGVDEPVRMNRPRSPAVSIARRAASHVEGTSCHSSMTWGRALQRQCGVGCGERLHVWVIEMNDAFSERQCGPGFAAPLGAPDLDGTEGGKQSLQAFVHEAGAVRQGLFCSV